MTTLEQVELAVHRAADRLTRQAPVYATVLLTLAEELARVSYDHRETR